jgi:two-component system response regulator AtoC
LLFSLAGPGSHHPHTTSSMESTSYWDEGAHPDFLLSVNDRVLQIRDKLMEVAPTRVPVVLTGEKGLGKEALAHTLHRLSPRSAGSFVRVNCYVVPRGQLGTELFGHAPEATTPFERARRGTLFVNGVETFSPEVCERFGTTLALFDGDPPDEAPRLIFSSETPDHEGAVKKLLRGIAEERAAVAVTLPPLRQRPEDIGLLAQHIMQLYSPFYSSKIKQLRASLIDLFKLYSWPGNVRELERVIRRFLVMEDESTIRRELEEKIWHRQSRNGYDTEDYPEGTKLAEISKVAAQKAEARAIQRVLERTRWNKKAAALELGVSYKSLLNKVRDYRLDN